VSGTAPQSYRVRIAGTTDGGDRVPDLTPREALERWIGKLRVDRADSTVSSYHYRLKLFVEWCEQERIDSIGDLSGWDIESYEAHRRNQGIEALTLKRELETLANFLEYCANIELVDNALPEKVTPPKVSRDEHVDESMLEPEVAEALLQHYRSDPEKRATRGHAVLEVAWHTGARLGALRGLDVDDYDADEQYVAFHHRPRKETPLKNGTDGERLVGLPETVYEILDEYIARERHEAFDDHNRRPLFASQVGRPTTNTLRIWMYLATVPCHYTECTHGRERETCEFVDYSKISQCPSSRSPHQVRTGSITWQRNRGVPVDVVSERVNSSPSVIEEHYDKPSKFEKMEKRRRPFLDRLDLDADTDNGGADE